MKKSFWFLIILSLLVVIFSVQNAEVVPIRFIVWQGELSLAILMILTFLFGLIVGAIYYAVSIKKKKKDKNPVGDIAFNDKTEEEISDNQEEENSNETKFNE
ncbi:LapA family protein [Plebeiibacterium sediminum]|uniref:LapA family protein n=1 Tax=Plebeiibacterium sediminum TaxID=2992112 RepID=A0AAE3M2L7_9BACT|nr:LapA family protein [Plebeiobacterium sediminum]MCW3785697.1 LapA family protein [Plebeiobacterium sediminum]